MIVLGFDTATPATAVALGSLEGGFAEAREDPRPGERPGHTTRLLELAEGLLAEAGLRWPELGRIAVGTGPGTFTGLRIGVATAQGLASSLAVELVGVSTLEALAHAALPSLAPESPPRGLLAVLDARRGEAFVAAYEATELELRPLLAPLAAAPEELEPALAEAQSAREGQQGGWLAVGDGALRFRAELEELGCEVPPPGSRVHVVSARALCELGARAEPDGAVLPAYGRRPDAEIALGGAAR